MPLYRKFWVKTTESQDINDMPDDFTRLLWVLLQSQEVLIAEGKRLPKDCPKKSGMNVSPGKYF